MITNSPNHIEELLHLMMDQKGFVSEKDRDAVFRRIRGKLENRQCFDCHNRNPTWLSMTYAVFVCLTCSGSHRRMGTHISFVRSCELDKFTRDQLIRMELGGNGKALTFFKSHGVTKPDFYSKLASKYKPILDKASEEVTRTCKVAELPAGEASLLSPTIQEVSADGCLDQPSLSFGTQQQQQSVSACATPVIHASSSVYPSVPQYYDFDSGKANGTSLSNVLMTHASVTGGLGGVARGSAKAKKLDQEFDFDEALEEAATSAVSAVPVVQPRVVQPFSGSPAPVINLYSVDATLGLAQPAVTGERSSPPARGYGTSSNLDPGLVVVANTRYANAKSISSAELFEDKKFGGDQTSADRLEMNAKFRRFHDCKGISSDAFHAGDPSLSLTKQDSNAGVGEQARSFSQSGIQILANGAQQTLTKARDWFNNFVLDEKHSSTIFR